MTDAPTPEIWADLRSRRPAYDDAYATLSAIPDAPGADILYGMDQPGDLHLLIPVTGGPTGQGLPDLQGLKVRHRHLSNEKEYLDLVASACHERVFSPLCGEIIKAVFDKGRQPWDAVSTIVRAWQSAWKPASSAMEKKVQIGLFGELLTLELVLLPAIGPRAVYHWSGPEYERHDFVGETLHLEVKTTTKSRHEHEISRLDQLRVPSGRRLMVVSLLLEKSLTGGETIATKMDAISDLLRTDPAASDEFQAKMVRAGWSDELRRSEELLRFHVRDSMMIPVDAAFPRLPDDFTPPTGVISIHYSVDLANLPSMGLDEVFHEVRHGF